MEILKFEQLPTVVATLTNEVRELKALLLQKAEPQPEIELPIQLNDVSLLTGYTNPTIYGYCQKNSIPYHKKNGRLFFFKSEIVNWIRTGKVKTLKELEADADTYLSNRKKGLK